jgi:archaellum component FlaG (FlaF/FlaG flagellin family)
VYGFGLNTYGQISSDFARKSSPVLIADKCISASAGTYYTAYIKQTGEVIVRGSNKSAVIGNGSISESYTAPYTAMKVKM